MKYKKGDILGSVTDTMPYLIYIDGSIYENSNHKYDWCYLDNELEVANGVPKDCYVVTMESLDLELLGNVYETMKVITDKHKCRCHIFDVMNYGCKCGGI